ncbi:SGNH/GDSL hydrolase family protein [Dermacoccaceae bacterium W4C1]
MGRARRARKIAAAAAYGGGGAAATGLAAYGLLAAEAKIARKVVGQPFEGAPEDSGTYGHGFGDPVRILVIGDSTARGMGADHRFQTVGATVSTAVAALSGRPVELTNVSVIGAESSDLDEQLDQGLSIVEWPDVALIMVGANDVTHRIDRSVAVRHLGMAVRRLRELGVEVVVGTCPDLGVIRPVPQPLRLIMQRWSRDLAAAQTVAVVEHGGRTVSLGDLIGPEFQERPNIMFSKDKFHPSPAGYARAASALLPSVLDALGQRTADSDRAPERTRGEDLDPVAVAARRAVADPGTEVSGTEQVGLRGRLAVLRRRHPHPLPESGPEGSGTTGLAADAESEQTSTSTDRETPPATAAPADSRTPSGTGSGEALAEPGQGGTGAD